MSRYSARPAAASNKQQQAATTSSLLLVVVVVVLPPPLPAGDRDGDISLVIWSRDGSIGEESAEKASASWLSRLPHSPNSEIEDDVLNHDEDLALVKYDGGVKWTFGVDRLRLCLANMPPSIALEFSRLLDELLNTCSHSLLLLLLSSSTTTTNGVVSVVVVVEVVVVHDGVDGDGNCDDDCDDGDEVDCCMISSILCCN
ncbi:hypothetical protein SAMD00019534_069210 [Acytostelium subglobosum LB1]|uniref:hypothetical protein n=1 Tax=Acytostelium subglobosum LB1 TaxID=1410327 RepID=UPI0006449AF4|nr:hypothetical protein SAMD00019534_069210 [Acytostelium subglobosum LB1]GAM23746.1 hypothetical protein SAMD00019534_069210 [Acytostelium subglobosum LB1]|eukprot:XP_012753487.1 hypothetical protein SAMD00019534_069210 [Acytostelium subglobosum LB1]